MRRSYVAAKRNIRSTLMNLLLFLVSSIGSNESVNELISGRFFQIPYLVMAVIYSNTTGRTQESIQDVRGALFTIVAEVVFTTAYSVIHFYPSQLPILRRETNEHIYKFSAYYVAGILSTIPLWLLRAFASITATYLLVGFYKGMTTYFQFVLTLVVASFTAHAYGLMLSGIFNSDALTVEIAPPLDLLFLVLAGMFINLDAYPYLRYISIFYYPNEALATLYWYDIEELGKQMMCVGWVV